MRASRRHKIERDYHRIQRFLLSLYDVTNMRTRIHPKSLGSVFARSAIVAPLAVGVLLSTGSITALAQQACCSSERERHEYSLASLNGSYAMIGTYAANVARGLGLAIFDGDGAVNGSALINRNGYTVSPAAQGRNDRMM